MNGMEIQTKLQKTLNFNNGNLRPTLVETDSSRNDSMLNSGIKTDQGRDYSPSQFLPRTPPRESVNLTVSVEKERTVPRIIEPSPTPNSSALHDFNPTGSKVSQVTSDEDPLLDSALRNNCYFKMLSEKELEEVKRQISVKNVKRNTEVIVQNTVGFEFYTVLKGTLDCFKVPEGRSEERFIRSYNQFQSFGELGPLNSSSRLASVRSGNDCVLISLSVESFNRYLKPKILEKRNAFFGMFSKFKIVSRLEDYQKYSIIDNLEPMSCARDTQLVSAVAHSDAGKAFRPCLLPRERHLFGHARRGRRAAEQRPRAGPQLRVHRIQAGEQEPVFGGRAGRPDSPRKPASSS
jgi:CRP-like cAMP-binding protein